MQAIRYHEYGGSDVLTIEDVPEPSPDRDEVKIDVHAAGVNPIDTYIREGDVSPAGGLPHILGADVAGIVVEAGAATEYFQPGDRVFATGLGLSSTGSYAEYVTVPEKQPAELPDPISFAEGAGAAMVFATAWRSLVIRGGLSVGDTCLVHGGSGGVGHAAVQIARHAGATVVTTARGGQPTDMVRSLGANVVVDYRDENLLSSIQAATSGSTFDVILESHADSNLEADLEILARGGHIIIIGEDDVVCLPPEVLMTAKVTDADLRFMSIMASPEAQRTILQQVAPLLADGTFEVKIAETYPLAEAADAHEDLMNGGTLGKRVLTL